MLKKRKILIEFTKMFHKESYLHEVQHSKTRKRENAKRENGFRVFNFIFKFQKIEFKNCFFMKFMKLKREFIKIWNENAKTKTNKQKVKLI